MLVYFRNLQRRLPFFAVHAILLLMGTLGIQTRLSPFSVSGRPHHTNAAWVTAGAIVHCALLSPSGTLLPDYELNRAIPGHMGADMADLGPTGSFFPWTCRHQRVGAEPAGFRIYGLTIERDIAISSIGGFC